MWTCFTQPRLPRDYSADHQRQPAAIDHRRWKDFSRIKDCDPRLPNASSTHGLQIGVADGSVRPLAPATSPIVIWGMVTPSGGEVIPSDFRTWSARLFDLAEFSRIQLQFAYSTR